jgi:carboxyl-terminal processing protease
MKKTILRILSYVLVALVAASTASLCFLFSQRNSFGKLQELEAVLDYYFIEEMDQKAVEDAASAAMVAALGDRWSYYMTAEQYLRYQDTMSNSYVGVGITVKAREDQRGIDIINVIAGGPAAEAGILAGDVLVGVDGTDTTAMALDAVSALIRGEENTKVKLTVERAGERKEFTITREKFETPVAIGKLLEGNIGLITIENFDARCAKETIAAIEDLRKQGATALIFDVRNNPGGYKHELVELLDYLLPEGTLFRTEDFRGKEEVDKSDANYLDMPMAVLVNLHSYSAAEFFAAALDEYDAAIVVGEKTFGKGYFQTTIPLRDGSAVNISIGKYYTPKGNSLAGVGLTPEVEVVVDEATAAAISSGTLTPEKDPQIIAAVNALKS